MDMGLSLADLRLRHETLRSAREEAQRAARDKDLGFAYALGEVETLIGILEERERQAAAADAAALADLEAAAGLDPEAIRTDVQPDEHAIV
jgi:hypothetical protein